tara:strand:- start:206 stop:571 length:366 start_codon:yes stop_codon:yes gene_type:complete
MKNFLKLVEENTPGNSKYEIVLRGPDGDVSKVDLSGTEYAYDLFMNIKKIIEMGEDIEVPAEDESGVLSPDETDALKVAGDLVKDPRRRSFQRDPKKTLERALGDMYKKVAAKVKAVAQKV